MVKTRRQLKNCINPAEIGAMCNCNSEKQSKKLVTDCVYDQETPTENMYLRIKVNKRAAAMMAIVNIVQWTWNNKGVRKSTKKQKKYKKTQKKSKRFTESCTKIQNTIPPKTVINIDDDDLNINDLQVSDCQNDIETAVSIETQCTAGPSVINIHEDPLKSENLQVTAYKIGRKTAVNTQKQSTKNEGDTHWYSDFEVESYFNVIEQSFDNILTISSVFYTTVRKRGYAQMIKWFKKLKSQHRLVLFPIVASGHWSLVAVYRDNKTILYFDSLMRSNYKLYIRDAAEHIKGMMDYLSKLHNDNDEWTLHEAECPSQQNYADCGPWVCEMGLCLAKSIKFAFTQDSMQDLRKKQLYTIKSKKLM